MAMKQDVNAPVIITAGAISGLLLIVVVIGIQAWYSYEMQAEYAAKNDHARNQALVDMETEQKGRIETYHWVDRDKQTVAVPIEMAMKYIARHDGQLPSTRPGDMSQ